MSRFLNDEILVAAVCREQMPFEVLPAETNDDSSESSYKAPLPSLSDTETRLEMAVQYFSRGHHAETHEQTPANALGATLKELHSSSDYGLFQCKSYMDKPNLRCDLAFHVLVWAQP